MKMKIYTQWFLVFWYSKMSWIWGNPDLFLFTAVAIFLRGSFLVMEKKWYIDLFLFNGKHSIYRIWFDFSSGIENKMGWIKIVCHCQSWKIAFIAFITFFFLILCINIIFFRPTTHSQQAANSFTQKGSTLNNHFVPLFNIFLLKLWTKKCKKGKSWQLQL